MHVVNHHVCIHNTCISIYKHTCIPIPTYLPTYSYLLTYRPTYLPTYRTIHNHTQSCTIIHHHTYMFYLDTSATIEKHQFSPRGQNKILPHFFQPCDRLIGNGIGPHVLAHCGRVGRDAAQLSAGTAGSCCWNHGLRRLG